jgi:VanZ family protein
MVGRSRWLAIVRWLPALLWMGWIFWLSSQQALPPPPGISYAVAAIVGHFILYAVLTFLLLIALGSPRKINTALAAATLSIALGYALSDEFHQSFVPGRDAAIFDLLIDALGVLFALTVWVIGWRKIASF